MTLHRILVAGDQGLDYDLYLPTREDNPPPGSPPATLRVQVGGAGISWRVLEAVSRQAKASSSPPWSNLDLEVQFERTPDDAPSPPTAGLWHKTRFGRFGLHPKDEDAEVWRAVRSLSLGAFAHPSSLPAGERPPESSAAFAPEIVLAEDNVGGYRFRPPVWLAPANPDGVGPRAGSGWPEWIVLKTGAPVGIGPLWWDVAGLEALARRLVVIVSIKDLRRAAIRVSQGISWERTALDLCRELTQSPALNGLRRAQHVIVTLHGEGAVWMRHPRTDAGDRRRFTLICDPGHLEGEWSRDAVAAEGDAYGYHSTFSAAVAAHLARVESDQVEGGLRAGIESGLRAMRLIRVVGHGPASRSKPELPHAALAEVILGGEPKDLHRRLDAEFAGALAADWGKLGTFGCVECPQPSEPGGAMPADWRILETGDTWRAPHQPLYGLGHRVARFGLDALRNIPYARFGALFTVDRDEIEALRNIQRLIQEYDRTISDPKPLSVAVFGPPGAGKSFGVKQVARTVVEESRQAFLEFNLSQFKDPSDLVGALHQVRDRVLEGKLPIVFWDEFDSGAFKWLQYLLAPMQDGKFQEGQITHPIGRCIFVFAGATSYRFEHFGPPSDPGTDDPKKIEEHRQALLDFGLKKGPDFKSRLHGYLNVQGPNPRQRFDPALPPGKQWPEDPTDVCFPVRRAILLRSWLGLMNPKKGMDRRPLEMDPGLVTALLEVGQYRHGARSMEKIVATVKSGGGPSYHRSALPTDEVLEMNLTDVDRFKLLLEQTREFQRHAQSTETLARAIHAAWEATGAKRQTAFTGGYDRLPAETKGDNIAAAVRIPEILNLVGLQFAKEPLPSSAEGAPPGTLPGVPPELTPAEKDVLGILEAHLDLLAEAEHDGWREVREANGWVPGPTPESKAERDHEKQNRRSHCLVSYHALKEEDRNLDRTSIRNYITVARLAGFKIVPKTRPSV